MNGTTAAAVQAKAEERWDAAEHAPRMDYARVAPEAVRAQAGLEAYIRRCGLEHSLIHLVKLRASYINGCAYCVDMHTKDARLEGEAEQRLYAVPVWRETPFFTARERAALAWTEALVRLPDGAGISDQQYEAVRREFSEAEVVNLTTLVNAINGWNRLAIALRAPVGSYVAGSAARTAEGAKA